MAQLYFKYGAMGSSKTANALMARFNYEERGQATLLVKPRLDTRDGDHMVSSRIGLTHPCIYFDEMQQMTDEQLQQYACIIVDEAQFLQKADIYYLVHLVDDCNIPVMCYGLRADFKGECLKTNQQTASISSESSSQRISSASTTGLSSPCSRSTRPQKLYIEVIAKGGGHTGRAIVRDLHTNVVLVEQDGVANLDKRDTDTAAAGAA